MRPVSSRSRGSWAGGSSSAGLWTLPLCQVTVRPRDQTRFWDDVKNKVEEMVDCDPAHRPLQGRDVLSSLVAAVETTVISGDGEVPPRQASGPVPVESTGQDLADAAVSPGHQAFPVLQGANHNTHQPLSWKAMSELRDKVGNYGLGSAEVMQVLQSFDADPLPPYDIQCLAHVLFRPVEYDSFEYKWTQLAGRVVEQNTALSQQDPRHVIGIDVLLGVGNFADLQRQAALDPLVLDQCHRMGMAAFVQTIEMAAPSESFAAVVQGAHEPLLQFAERLTASVDRQVEDLNKRMLVLKNLVRTNCNAECRRIIEALHDDPSLLQMVQACAKSSVHRAENRLQGNGSFRSTGLPQVHWTTVLTKNRPEKVCTLSIPVATPSEICLHGLLDTGADIMILSLAAWPLEWPLDSVQTSVAGLAGTVQYYLSERPVMIMNPEGQMAMVWPHVTAKTRVSLWGRDVLAKWGVRIGMDF
ncbi:hypothetical protein DUI87_27615 [Hirundo rustica rustica]|uniref:Peptidase A2 domain-containing protein n=1 Tax=Hirundo rustica rustica TaxID=333673 RepID=A0A3M0JL03_HIRRU|nr:hypothetical protein DUI87_27615 [Hirundo rustica rustica]